MPSPAPFENTSGDGVTPVYEDGRFTPSCWGTAWGNSWSTAWGWHRLLKPYLETSKPYQETTSG